MMHNAGITALPKPEFVSPRAGEAERADFDRLIREHHEQVARTVSRLMAWPSEQSHLDDVVQNVFTKAWLKWHAFRGESSEATWLTRIAINEVRNFMRGRARWIRVKEHLKQRFAQEATEASLDCQAKVKGNVHEALRRLKPAEREIVVLRYLEERNVDEIAKLLDIKRNTVDARLSRVRRKLATMLTADRSRCHE